MEPVTLPFAHSCLVVICLLDTSQGQQAIVLPSECKDRLMLEFGATGPPQTEVHLLA